MIEAKAIVFTGIAQCELQQVQIPEPGPGQVLLETKVTAASVGTEMRVFGGVQEPNQQFPVVPGYAQAGVVIRAGEGAESWLGKRVLGDHQQTSIRPMWGAHCSMVTLSAGLLVEMPDSVPFEQGVLSRLAAIAWRGVDLSAAQPEESVMVVGLGVIGHMAARLYASIGCRVVGVDLAEPRTAALERAGIKAVCVPTLADATGLFDDGPDVLVDATGNAPVLEQTIKLAKDLAWNDLPKKPTRLIVQGSYPDKFTGLYDDAFRKQLIMMFPRDCTLVDKQKVMSLIGSGALDLAGLASVFPVDEAPAVYARLWARDSSLMAPVFEW
jgi:2-desacetyl-2-hydroxyethyl bacteriochlorophyllide A dehydrogenase